MLGLIDTLDTSMQQQDTAYFKTAIELKCTSYLPGVHAIEEIKRWMIR